MLISVIVVIFLVILVNEYQLEYQLNNFNLIVTKIHKNQNKSVKMTDLKRVKVSFWQSSDGKRRAFKRFRRRYIKEK